LTEEQPTPAQEPEAAEGKSPAPDTPEIEQLKMKLAETEQRARSLEISAARNKAASEHGLSEDLLEFITAEDEAGAKAQAEKLAAIIKSGRGLGGPGGLPQAGGRNPANGAEQSAKQDEQDRFEAMRRQVPALSNRVLRSG
jgi:hypothetical protein